MSAQPRRQFTPAEYLAWEREQPEKHAYHWGETYAMSGGKPSHAAIPARMLMALGPMIQRKGCHPFTSDLRVRQTPNNYVYPDLTVVCGEPEIGEGDTLLNPALIVEVLSPSTEAWDRGGKLKLYRGIASVCEIVLVPQNSRDVEVHYRMPRDGAPDGWGVRLPYETDDGLTIEIATLDAHLDLDVLYNGLDLGPGPRPPGVREDTSGYTLATPETASA